MLVNHEANEILSKHYPKIFVGDQYPKPNTVGDGGWYFNYEKDSLYGIRAAGDEVFSSTLSIGYQEGEVPRYRTRSTRKAVLWGFPYWPA
jgi:hypothetical protein